MRNSQTAVSCSLLLSGYSFFSYKENNMYKLKECIKQGRGETPADKILTGGRIFDLITGDFIEGDVAICGQTIVGIATSYAGKEFIDVTYLTLVPGFVDTTCISNQVF